MKKRIFAALLTLCMVITLLPTAALPTAALAVVKEITGNSVYRDAAATATIRFMSDAAGTYYYQVTDSAAAPSAESIKTGKTGTGEAYAGTNGISITGMTAGAKYAHIIVESTKQYSNVLTVAMPYDCYYFDDNEAYADGTALPTSSANITAFTPQMYLKYNGGSAENQKIISVDGQKVMQTIGSYGKGLDARVPLSAGVTSGYIVWEADMTYFTCEIYGNGFTVGQGDSDTRNLYFLAGKGGKFTAGNVPSLTPSGESFTAETQYHVKVVLDVANDKYDCYVDGTNVYDAPRNAASYDAIEWFGVYACGKADYDNQKMYVTSTIAPPALTGTVEITGTEKYGQTLTADTTGISNNTGTLLYQWKRDGNSIDGATGETYILAAADVGKTITCAVTSSVETGTLSDSTGTIGKADGPAVTGVSNSDCTTAANNNGTLINVSDAMEYKLSTASDWTPADGSLISGLANGTYYVRVEETGTHKAGAQSSFVVAAYSAPPSGGSYISPTTYTVPVRTGDNSVSASATVSRGTAEITVNMRRLGELLEGSGISGLVSIDAGLNKNIDSAAIPVSAVDKIADAVNDADKNIDGLGIKLDTGSVSLDAKALAAASGQAEGRTIVIYVEEIAKSGLTEAQKKALAGDHADDLIVEVTIKSGNTVISDCDGGKITVTLPYELKEGEIASGVRVWHLASDGSLTLMECSYDETAKTVSFVTDHLSDFIVGYDRSAAWVNPFTDVAEDSWFYNDVAYANAAGLMEGTSDTTFNPHGAVTRGMIVEMLYRFENEPSVTGVCPFDDVTSGKYYESAVTWAAANKLIEGYGDGTFRPAASITREEMAAILYRYEKLVGGGFTGAWAFPLSFTDTDEVSDWAYEALCWCAVNGIIIGNDDGTLAPQGTAERCQAAAVLHRFIDNIER